MLPAPARLRRREDFTLVVRRGRRAGRSTLVAHYLPPDPADGHAPPAARAGFVVGRAVGGSVVRHRTVRRLRHLVRDRLALLPPGSRLVVRALPPAAEAGSAALARDLDAALRRLGLAGSAPEPDTSPGAGPAPGPAAPTGPPPAGPAGPRAALPPGVAAGGAPGLPESAGPPGPPGPLGASSAGVLAGTAVTR